MGGGNQLDLSVTPNVKWYIRTRGRDTYGNYGDMLSFNMFHDNVAPTITNRNTYWQPNLSDGENANFLKWSVANVNDKYDFTSGYGSSVTRSGFVTTRIYRSKVKLENKNPDFSLGQNGSFRFGALLWGRRNIIPRLKPDKF